MAGIIPALLLTALLAMPAETRAADLWVINIDNAPAPSPEDGPPLSYYASRNPALLPYQIIGVVAGYFGFMLLLGTLLLTVGRPLRQRARWNIDHGRHATEMTKPMSHMLDASPLSMRSQHVWGGAGKKGTTASSIVTVSPVNGHHNYSASFDVGVLERDRNNLRAGLAEIYGAVYEAEDSQERPAPLVQPTMARPTDLRVTTTDLPQQRPPSQRRPISQRGGTPHRTRSQSSSVTNFSKPMSPVNSGFPGSSDGATRPQQAPFIPRELQHLVNDEDVEETLPPQYYFEPRSPDLPSSRTPEIHHLPAAVPATALDWNDPSAYPRPPPPPAVANPRGWPQANPQRPATSSASPVTLVDTPTRDLRNARSAGNVNNQLPLRQHRSNTALLSRQTPVSTVNTPLHPAPFSPGLISPTPIVHRTLDVPDNPFLRSIPTGLRTPLTGGLMSTQSTFMQYNHAETRAERKQREREERSAYGPISEAMVPDDEDLWAGDY